MNPKVSLSNTPMAHPPRSNPFLRSSADAPPFPCITPSTVTCVMVVSFMVAATGLLALVVLRCALDRRYPALAPLHPDLVFGLQLEGRVIQTSDPNLDERVAGVACVKEPRPTTGAEAATVIA